MNTTITFITDTRHALVTALAMGKTYNPEAEATRLSLLAAARGMECEEGRSIRETPLAVWRLTLPASEAIGLAAFLYSPAFAWPVNWADLEEREYIVRSVVTALHAGYAVHA